MSLKTLIVNADDLAWTEGVNRGILEAHRYGLVTSASLLANGAAFSGAVASIREAKGLGVGVHLNLSDGSPVLPRWKVASLVNERGEMTWGPGKLLWRAWTGRLRLDEVEREWDAQIRKVKEAGIAPTHVDGHKHVHMLPGFFAVAVRVAQRNGIRAIRVSEETPLLRGALANGGGPRGTAWKQAIEAKGLGMIAGEARELARSAGLFAADYFCGLAATGILHEKGVESLLWNLPEGETELMTHPGYAGEELRGTATRLQQSREEELRLLQSERLAKIVASNGIRLVHYGLAARHHER